MYSLQLLPPQFSFPFFLILLVNLNLPPFLASCFFSKRANIQGGRWVAVTVLSGRDR